MAGSHHHHHEGHHAPDRFGRIFLIGIGLNVAFVLVEIAAGVFGHSVALLADAGHNVSDVLGLVAAWLAQHLTRRQPTDRFTYGLGSSSILAALFNAVLLLVVIGGLSVEAFGRFARPEPVEGGLVMVVAAIGIAVNGGVAMLFAAGRHDDMNIRGAFLHMAADALVSLGVLVAGGIILLTGQMWLDPLVSLIVNGLIVVGTWGLLRDSLALCLNAVPAGIAAGEVRAFLLGQAGVAALHDFHIWPMSTTESVLSAHLVMPAGHPGDGFLATTAATLHERFRIGHVTLQIETDAVDGCAYRARHVPHAP